MFHNSTTTYRFPHNTAFRSGENRLVYAYETFTGAMREVASAGKSMGKSVFNFVSRNPVTRYVFGPFFMAAKAGKWTYDRGKDALYGTEWAGRTAVEGAKGVWGMTGKPVLTLGYSAINDVKICLWDLPLSVFSAAIRTPIAIAKSPLNLIRGVREAIKSVPKNVKELYSNALNLDVRNMVRNTFKTVSDIVKPPIKTPLVPILVPPAHVISTAARSKLQYALAVKAAGKDIANGYRRVKGAPGEASKQMAAVTATRLEIKQKLQEEKMSAREEGIEKLEKVKGTGKKEKGKAKGGQPVLVPATA